MTEKQLQDTVIEICKLYGIAWYHTYSSKRSPSGWPDLALCGRVFIVRELKAASGRLTDDQAEWGARLRHAGISWAVWRPADLHSGLIQRELAGIR